MKNTKFLLLPFLLITACSSMNKLVEPPKVKVSDVRLTSAKDEIAVFEIIVDVTNPNDISATVDRLKYDLQVNEKTVTSGVYDKDVKIEAHKTTQVAIPLSVKYSDLFKTALNMLISKGAPYRAVGSVKVGPFDIPFDEKGMLKLKDL